MDAQQRKVPAVKSNSDSTNADAQKLPDHSSRAPIVRELDRTMADAHAADTFEEALRVVALQTRLMIGAHQSAISFIPGGSFTAALHTHSFSEKYEKYNSYDVMPTGEGIWACMAENRRTVRMTEAELLDHPRFRNFSGMKDARGLEHPPMIGWLAVPVLRQSGEFLGLMQLSDKYEGDFSEQDQEQLTHIAHLILPIFELQYVNRQLDERTDELRKRSQDLADANLAKSRFLANMGHELRTPLNVIIGYSELLKDEATAQGQDAFLPDLDKITRAGQQLLALINDILDVARMDAGKTELVVEPFAVADVIADVVSAAAPLIEKGGNRFETVCGDGLGEMCADAAMLRKVLLNLLGNAAKFTRDGRIALEVGREAVNGAEGFKFRVRDTGIGMSPEQSKEIFDVFIQADGSANRQYDGTGLGLAISRRICTLMSGDIQVESEPGAGSVFTVRLPASISR